MQNIQKTRLNVDIAGAISEFLSVIKGFRLKKDIYKIVFRGKGLEFESYRDFVPDDDAQLIDWKASSRSQKLLVKQYKEERDLKVFFLVDVGDNMVFGSTNRLKCEYVAELVSSFSKLIMEANDRVGFFLFSEGVKHFIPPKRGEKHFHFFVDLLTNPKTYGGITNIDLALDFAMRYLDKSVHSVILISDFLRVSQQTEKKLGLLSNMFETIVIRVRDPLDFTLPDINQEIILQSPNTQEQVIINPGVAKSAYEKYAREQSKLVEQMFKKSEADYIDLFTNRGFSIPLAMFLKERLLNKK